MRDDNGFIEDKVTYKFERFVTYKDGSSYTDAKLWTVDADDETFSDVFNYVYGWLRSAFGHIEAPDHTEKESCQGCRTTYDDWK